MSADSRATKKVVVLGAGIIGMTTALLIQQQRPREYSVLVVAEHSINPYMKSAKTPSGKTVEYPETKMDFSALEMTSPIAGAHWRSLASNSDTFLQQTEALTYKHFMNLAIKHPNSGVRIVEGVDLYLNKKLVDDNNWHFSLVKDFKVVSDLPEGVEYATNYKTLVVNPIIYIDFCKRWFLMEGGKFVTGVRVKDLRELEAIAVNEFMSKGDKSPTPVAQHFSSNELTIINCAGLGGESINKSLVNTNSKLMYPVKGQVVLVYAPSMQHKTITKLGGKYMSYVIPRGSGTVILGGTHQPHEYTPDSDPMTTDRILEECLKLAPELVEGSPEDDFKSRLEILKSNVLDVKVGFRPGRVGGVNLSVDSMYGRSGNTIRIIHNYGHNGYGFQSSYGYAVHALNLLRQNKL
ncbi:D-amino-acid oxidase [Zancudomyces culisetae]|uniref:D-amino-acid oxidase n=1 Tax=Zancudomyces culisetae TaxID=1213189 RepID=A0A1R1PXB0_ZANCU|nr:D-amino-acid oxidase [Zancudomyces culisetae]|eukprot:OMH85572.1 D-amino-acid oxidase [Zancudomyces culisetae]